MLYENLKQDIHLKIYEKVTLKSIKNIKNINGYIFTFAKNHCLNELERQNKLNKIKEIINEHTRGAQTIYPETLAINEKI